MTNFENITIEMDLEDIADFLNSIESIEDAPWNKWFNTKYCNSGKCPTLTCKYDDSDRTCECAYCELTKKKNSEGVCCFFSDKDILGSGKDVVRLWLRSEVVDDTAEM